MQVMYERLDQNALAVDSSAAALGLDEFSLLSRIQAGEIKAARATSGEMVIPQSELERLAGGSVHAQLVEGNAILPDERLGIERRRGGLKQNGQLVLPYKVSGCRFSEGEINGYRAASSAIAGRLDSIKDFKRQLTHADQLPESCDFEINTPEIGRWEVRSALLNLNHGEILLCQRGNAFAVIERFHVDSPYAKVNGAAQMLWEGSDAQDVAEAFKADARLTLKFMASNLTAKAQRIVWEQFPEHRFGRIMEAVSDRCRQAVANEETISQKVTQSVGRRIGV
jgi:hypothetical protein